MSIAKNQKKLEKRKKISACSQILKVISLIEKDILLKFLVDFLIVFRYHQFLSRTFKCNTRNLIDLLKFDRLNSFYLNLR